MKRYNASRTTLFFLLILILAVGPAVAEEPLDVVRNRVNAILDILKDPQYAEAEKRDAHRQRIWQETDEIFDYLEMSKRVLARNWREFSPAQRQEFTAVFSELLKNFYTNIAQTRFHNNQVDFLDQSLMNSKAMVKTNILDQEGKDNIVNYSLHQKNGKWLIYDVNIQGIGSLVMHYRKETQTILAKQNPEGLVKELQAKIQEIKNENSSAE